MNEIKFIVMFASVAFLLNLIITPIIIFLSKKHSWYDHVNDRKIHEGKIPRIGGVGIFVSFLIAFFFAFLFCDEIKTGNSKINLPQFFAINATFIIMFATGLLDDFKNIKARYKLVAQIVAAIILIAAGFYFKSVYIPFLNESVSFSHVAISYVITFFWLIGVSNAVNLIDGMDGLAGGTSFISLLFLGVFSILAGDSTIAFLAFILMGAILGFLAFNFPPAKIFMGDSGSLLLGITLASIPLIGNTETESMTLLVSITILLIPITDTIAAMLRRTFIKKVHFFKPDKEHLHHKLLDLGFSVRGALLLLYFVAILLGLTTILWAIYRASWTVYLILSSWVIVIILYNLLSFFHRRHLKNLEDFSN